MCTVDPESRPPARLLDLRRILRVPVLSGHHMLWVTDHKWHSPLLIAIINDAYLLQPELLCE